MKMVCLCHGTWVSCEAVYMHLCVVVDLYMIALVMRGPEKGRVTWVEWHGLRLLKQCVLLTLVVDMEWLKAGRSNVMR